MTNKKPYVLLVEDEYIIQAVHSAMLKKLGCDIDLVETGEQALAKPHAQYSLILMDIGLPDMRGNHVIEKIRKLTPTLKIPIIAVTAYLENTVDMECHAAGANAIYQKPLSIAVLNEILKKYI